MDLVKRISQVKQISAFIKIPNARISCKVQMIADNLLIQLFDRPSMAATGSQHDCAV